MNIKVTIFCSIFNIKSQISPQERQERVQSQVRGGVNPYAGEKLIVMFPILNFVLLQQTCSVFASHTPVQVRHCLVSCVLTSFVPDYWKRKRGVELWVQQSSQDSETRASVFSFLFL